MRHTLGDSADPGVDPGQDPRSGGAYPAAVASNRGVRLMHDPQPRFAFSPDERAQIMVTIGRSDIAATTFVNDVEACLQAFQFASSGGASAGLPDDVARDMATIVATAAELRSALYRLPGDLALLIDLHLLADGARRRIAADLSQLVEPLEDIAGSVAEIRHASAASDALGKGNLKRSLVRALAATFRNRLNRKPSAEAESGFPQALARILELAAPRLPFLAALDEARDSNSLRRYLREAPPAD